MNGLCAAHSLKAVILKDAEELRLESRRHVSDLVQEHAAGMGQLELSLLGLMGPGKSPPLVTEELTLQQVLGESHTVHDDEGPVASPAPAVDGVREDFFPRATLTQKKDRGIIPPFHRVYDAAIMEGLQCPGYGQRASREAIGISIGAPASSDDDLRMVGVEWRGGVVAPSWPPRGLDGAVGGDHDCGNVNPARGLSGSDRPSEHLEVQEHGGRQMPA
jgi:hypothetical protein